MSKRGHKLGVDSKFTFGKYNGTNKTFADILKLDPTYLLWMRHSKSIEPEQSPFTKDADLLLDILLENNAALRSKYAYQYSRGERLLYEKELEKRAERQSFENDLKEQKEQQINNQRNASYAGMWGSWS